MLEIENEIYIIGFPKSGNTWLARLIAEITSSKIALVNNRDNLHKVENTSDRDGKYLIHKIHYTYDLQRVLSSKKIYIIRDPRDVFVSGFFHNHRIISEDKILSSSLVKKLFDYEVRGISKEWQGNIFGRNIRRPVLDLLRALLFKPKMLKIGNWSTHIKYWAGRDDIVIVKYEDLLEKTEEVLRGVLQKLDIHADEDKIKKTVENQSFARKKKKFVENGDIKNAKFMRSGKNESWRKLVDKELQNIIERDHEEIMNKYGYKLAI